MIKLNENIYNVDYINKHTLSQKKIREAGIELKGLDEIFVQYPKWNDYYGSNYGRLISTKYGDVKLCKAYPCGEDGEDKYLGYKMTKVTYGQSRKLSITCHRLVADIFLPNFWGLERNKLQAHHLDHSKSNNYYKNLILLPTGLHTIMNNTKKMVLFKNKTFRTSTPYQIMEQTGLTLDEIIMAAKKGKPVKSDGKYSVFDVKGHLIGFQFYPKKNKKKN